MMYFWEGFLIVQLSYFWAEHNFNCFLFSEIFTVFMETGQLI